MRGTWHGFLLIRARIGIPSAENFVVLDKGLECAVYPGPSGGIDINLVGGQRLNLSGDRLSGPLGDLID